MTLVRASPAPPSHPFLTHYVGSSMKAEPRDEDTPLSLWPCSARSWSYAAASGDWALIPRITAWAGRNEAGVMGEEGASLRSLHFLELMTSLRARQELFP